VTGWEPTTDDCWGGRPIARRVADAAPRRRVVISGTIVAVEMRRWRRVAACTAQLDDGTGRLTLVFTRPRPVPGFAEGVKCTVEGTVLPDDDELTVWNPFYRFDL
jgi:hypothetical protein